MWVECKDNSGGYTDVLTVGKAYQVLQVREHTYQIVTDCAISLEFRKNRFVRVEESTPKIEDLTLWSTI
jgi:hypothetical protein